MRNRAGIILWCESKKRVLLIKRIKNNDVYYVVAGGGVNEGESFEAAAKRELYEETGICVERIRELVGLTTDRGYEKYYISMVSDTYDITILGEELKRQSELNRYIPEWVSLDKLNEVNLFPAELKKFIKREFV